MIDAIHTVTSTIKKKLDELRFLGKNDTKTFKRILQAIILMDLIEWCGDHSEYDDQTVQSRLEEIRDSIFLRNCEFDIKHTGAKVYASVNIPSSNDEWKLVTDAPFVKILNTSIQPIVNNYFAEISNTTCIPKEVPFENYKTIQQETVIDGEIKVKSVSIPDIDISNFDDCERMNTYIKTNEDGSKEIWFLDSDGTWKSGYTSQNGVGTEQVNSLIDNKIKTLRIKDFEDSGSSMVTEIVNDTTNTGKLEVANDNDIKSLL